MRYIVVTKAPARYPVQGRGLGTFMPGDPWTLSQEAMGPMTSAGYAMPATDWSPWILGGAIGLVVGLLVWGMR